MDLVLKSFAWAVLLFVVAASPAFSQTTNQPQNTSDAAKYCTTPGLKPEFVINNCSWELRYEMGLDGKSTPPGFHPGEVVARIGNAYRRMGQNDLAAKHFAFAVQLASKPLAQFPDSYKSLQERCWIRAVANIEIDAALADCDHSLRSDPSNSDTLRNKGFVLYRQGKYEEALAAYNAALTVRSKNSDAMFMRGLVKQKLGDETGAVSDLKAANDLDYTIAVAYQDYGVAPN